MLHYMFIDLYVFLKSLPWSTKNAIRMMDINNSSIYILYCSISGKERKLIFSMFRWMASQLLFVVVVAGVLPLHSSSVHLPCVEYVYT